MSAGPPWHVAARAHAAQSPDAPHAPLASRPQTAWHVPFGMQASPFEHGDVGLHSAHWFALHAVAPAQVAQSASSWHGSPQMGEHAPALQTAGNGHCDVSASVHAPQLPSAVSQT